MIKTCNPKRMRKGLLNQMHSIPQRLSTQEARSLELKVQNDNRFNRLNDTSRKMHSVYHTVYESSRRRTRHFLPMIVCRSQV
jgi:hypothetical protein